MGLSKAYFVSLKYGFSGKQYFCLLLNLIAIAILFYLSHAINQSNYVPVKQTQVCT